MKYIYYSVLLLPLVCNAANQSSSQAAIPLAIANNSDFPISHLAASQYNKTTLDITQQEVGPHQTVQFAQAPLDSQGSVDVTYYGMFAGVASYATMPLVHFTHDNHANGGASCEVSPAIISYAGKNYGLSCSVFANYDAITLVINPR